MLIISFFTGGVVQHGPVGVYYSKGPTANFTVRDDFTLEELEVKLSRFMGISRSTHGLAISARFNAQPPPVIFYSELQIMNNDTWRLVVNHLLSGHSLAMVELFVEPINRSNIPMHGFASSSGTYESPPVISTQVPCFNTSYEPIATLSRGFEAQEPPIPLNVDPISSYIPPNPSNNEEEMERDGGFNVGLDGISPADLVENTVMEDPTPIGNTCGNYHFDNMDFEEFVPETNNTNIPDLDITDDEDQQSMLS